MLKVKCTLYTNLRLEGKAGSFNVTQVSRFATKDQNFNLEARWDIYMNLSEHFTKASVLVT